MEEDTPEALLFGETRPDPVDELYGGERDEMFGELLEEEGDPMTAMSPPRPVAAKIVPTPAPVPAPAVPVPKAKGMTPAEYATELARIRKLPNEKDRMQAMANLMLAKKNGTPLAAPAPPAQQRPAPVQVSKPAPAPQAQRQETSMFPSPQDLSDMEAFVLWTTLAMVIHGQLEAALLFKELHVEGLSPEDWEKRRNRYRDIKTRAVRFLSRCLAMQGRLIAALEVVYKIRNPVLWKIIECMHACKLVVSSKPK